MRHFQWTDCARAIAASGFAAVVGTAASASEFCVTCDGPVAHYACTFEGVAGTAIDTRLKLLCITELAKSGQHASCSVDRQQQTPCKGEMRQLALPSGIEIETPEAANAGKAPAQQSVDAPAAAATEPPPATQTDIPKTASPPKTVKEAVESGVASTEKAIEDSSTAAGEAAKATGSTLQKAGKAVGDAAKKTWDCITSFGDC